jgi:hypothetical protein
VFQKINEYYKLTKSFLSIAERIVILFTVLFFDNYGFPQIATNIFLFDEFLSFTSELITNSEKRRAEQTLNTAKIKAVLEYFFTNEKKLIIKTSHKLRNKHIKPQKQQNNIIKK